jgi:ABC-type transport system involved in multi-copper enzyme maturation permease subunit
MENNKDQQDESAAENNVSIFTEEEFSIVGYDKHIRQARNAIFWVAGLLTVNVAMLFMREGEVYEYMWLDFLIYGGFIGAFIFLGFFTKKKPYTAIIMALILYTLFILLNAVIEPMTLLKGFLFKIITYVFLIKAINDAKEAQEMQKTFGT